MSLDFGDDYCFLMIWAKYYLWYLTMRDMTSSDKTLYGSQDACCTFLGIF